MSERRTSLSRNHGLLLISTAIATSVVLSPLSSVSASERCNTSSCDKVIIGKSAQDGSTRNLTIGANVEKEHLSDAPSIPFHISVDGEAVEHSSASETTAGPVRAVVKGPRKVDVQRKADVGLRAVDIQVKFDGLDSKPLLNIEAEAIGNAAPSAQQVRFFASSNYPAFFERAEIIIYRAGERRNDRQPVAVIPANVNRITEWDLPKADAEYQYVLRVYDAKGRYDETQAQKLSRTNLTEAEPKQAVAPGMTEDMTATRNISVHGGAVTVYGRNVPTGYQIQTLGDEIPVDNERSFVAQRILPPGEHAVQVSVLKTDRTSNGLHFQRDVNIPDNDWFYVGLVDLTLGKRKGDENIETVRSGEYDEVYSKGRLAFYLKGKIKGEYLLTAAADSSEGDLKDLFRNLDGKDPRRLLRRLDPDDFYPVYGDDSTFTEDAPTNGKFFVRLDKGSSHAMWGNYKTSITGTEFIRQERALYGAQGVYRSEDSTSFGERRTEISAYAAQANTFPQREEFLSTGGSAFFLKRQDIVEGSETLSIETRDAVTGRVIRRQTIRFGEDYEFDYMQGVVILKTPLSWTASQNGAVRDGALGGGRVYLVAQYEYEPIVSEADGYVFGGRAQNWVNDKLRVGVTGMDESTGQASQQAFGADVQLRHSETTYLEAEVATSKGPGFGRWISSDGGLTSSNTGVVSHTDRSAQALRVKGQVDLADVTDKKTTGNVGGYYEKRDAGFSSLQDQVYADKRLWGAHADVGLTDSTALKLTYDDFSDAEGQSKREGTSNVTWQLDDSWKLSLGLNYYEVMSPLAKRAGKSGYDGSRLDAGARIDYSADEKHQYYAFGQGTVSRSGDIVRNDRIGTGAKIALTEKLTAEAEASYGTRGWSGLAGLSHNPDADTNNYIGYRLDPDRSFDINRNDTLVGRDKGAIVGGTKRRMSDIANVYAESSYDIFGRKTSLAQTYGVVYTPDDLWTIDGGFSAGHVRDDTVDTYGVQRSDFDRYAPSLSIGYKDEEAGIAARLRGEVRIEDSEDNSRDQNSYLLAGGVSWKVDESSRVLADFDAVLSESRSMANASFQDTDYVEASLGYAYRPVSNDRLNMLFKYTWLYDMPGNGQLVSGSTRDLYAAAQRSHILSADLIYDLTPWLSVGGKYGLRFGEIRNRVDNGNGTDFVGEWTASSAHLGIIRADLHVVKKWDLVFEGRALYMPQADTIDYGALAAVYRHIGGNIKLGLGYNFGVFSDDLRDLTLDDRGVFVNVVGKF